MAVQSANLSCHFAPSFVLPSSFLRPSYGHTIPLRDSSDESRLESLISFVVTIASGDSGDHIHPASMRIGLAGGDADREKDSQMRAVVDTLIIASTPLPARACRCQSRALPHRLAWGFETAF